MHDAVDGVEVGVEAFVVLPWAEDEFGKSLNGMGRIFGEQGFESFRYGVEKRENLRREAAS